MPKHSAKEEIVWRRTVDGWEKVNDWTFALEKSPPALHPGILGLLMVTLSLTVGIVKQEPRNNQKMLYETNFLPVSRS